MKRIILLLLLAVVSVGQSCKKPKDPSAVIIIEDVSGKALDGAIVNINSRAAVQGVVDTVLHSDQSGKVYYSRKFECILEARVSHGKLTGTEYFQLKSNEVTEKTIVVK